ESRAFGCGVADPGVHQRGTVSDASEIRLRVVEQIIDRCDGDPGDRAFDEPGVLDCAPDRGIAAVTTAVKADTGRVGDSLRDGPFDAILEVVLHFVAPFTVAGRQMLPSESRGS